jgi:hypothetical protein
MWIEAILTRDDLDRVMGSLCPLKISLGQGGNLLLSEPRDLELVADIGLRMAVTLEVHWPVLGIQIPVSVRTAVLDVRPEISGETGGNLAFKLHLDEVDIAILPEFVDRGIVDLVNKELEAKHVELSWSFIQTLSHVFELPEALASARAVDLRAAWGRVKITSEALVLAVSFEVSIEPRDSSRVSPPRPLARVPAAEGAKRAPLEPSRRQNLWRRSPATLLLLGGAAVLASIGVSALVMLLRRPRGIVQTWAERLRA